MNDQLSKIKYVVDYIEDNLKESITLDKISRASGLSPFYLHRLFKAITGFPMMRYVRARRLSKSVGELLQSDFSILDIAVEYGFEHEQSYSRAFRKQFGVNPARFRLGGIAVPYVPKIIVSNCLGIADGILVSPRYAVMGQMHLVGQRGLVNHSKDYTDAIANRIGVDFFYTHSKLIPNAVNRKVYYGFTVTVDEQSSWYQPSMETADLSAVPNGMTGTALPASRYAVFTYIGQFSPSRINFKILNPLYQYIFGFWLPQSGETKIEPYHFERIDTGLCNEKYCEMNIFIPLAGLVP